MGTVKKYFRINDEQYRYICTVAGLYGSLPEEMIRVGALRFAKEKMDELIARSGNTDEQPLAEELTNDTAGGNEEGSVSAVSDTTPDGEVG